MRLALVLLLFVITLFAGRLVQMQGLDGPAVAARALSQRTTTVELTAHRGDVTDATGAVLATTVDRRNLLVDQNLVARYARYENGTKVTVGVQGAAQDLSRVLGVDVGVLVPRLTGTSKGAYVMRDVTPEVARAALRLPIPGLGVEEASRRTYPAGTTAANVLGFVSAGDGKAWGGVEEAYNRTLSGRPGSLSYERGRDGTRIPTGDTQEVEPQPGSTVRLTLLRDLQWRAQQLLDAQVAATGAASGDVVALDARTGAVLALATSPTFDPNDPSRGRSQSNRPLVDVFEPGSTAKVVTMAAALQEGVATPETRLTVPNRLPRAATTFRDAEDHGTEQLTVAGVLAQSSNIGTILTGEKVPPKTLYAYLTGFGLGSKTGVELAENAGVVAPVAKWNDSQRYTVMFGQGLSVTALQAAGVFQTVANDGVRLAPHLVAGVTDASGAYHPTAAGRGTKVISPEVASQLRLMMENVVGEHGTAAKAEVPGYRVAGKTGTASAVDPACGCYRGYTASFIGMAPADDPAVVIAVVLQRPVKGHFGGEVAAPVFAQLMTSALAELKVPPTGTTTPQIPLRW